VKNHARAVSSNGIFRPVIVADGKVIGIWKKTTNGTKLSVDMKFFGKPESVFREKIQKSVMVVESFLGSH
jgi:hypothetical protein